MECPTCRELGLESEVFKGGGDARLGKPYPHIDSNGNTHYHEIMFKYDKYSCYPHLHNWKVKLDVKCPECGYEYTGEPDPLFGPEALAARES